MLAPKKQKYRKTFRGKNRGKATRGSEINFGEFALKAMVGGVISANQIEAARRAIAHFTKREGGKGDVQGYVSPVTPGKILFELAGVSDIVAVEALKRAADKLPIKTRFLKKE
jgi:large subunit ribosomal protein L16